MNKSNISYKYLWNNCVKILIFLSLGILFLFLSNNLFRHKWVYPDYYESPKDLFEEFYNMEDPESIQAFFLGASHIRNSVDPMKIYKDSGIATFNFATSAQSIQASYHLAEEIFHYYHPKYIFFDVSSLFFMESNIHFDSIIIDNMKFGRNKIDFIKNNPVSDSGEGINKILTYIFPLFHYHSRWETLNQLDFNWNNENQSKDFYRKGYFNMIKVEKYWTDIQLMNTTAYWNNSDENGKQYNPTVSDWNYNYLQKIIQLCRDNSSTLILVKIPIIGPAYYSENSAWTIIKSDIVKKIAEQNNVYFLDLLYDNDPFIDWEKDSSDGGYHLNYRGARKVSEYFEDYLKDNSIPAIKNKDYESDLATYESMALVSDLVSATSFFEYLELLKQMENVTIIISASDDMTNSISEETIRRLESIGVKSDFSKINFRDSYIAVINNGESVFEEYSDKRINHQTVIGDNNISVESSGFMTSSNSQIKINWKEYSLNNRGLNIVVLDNRSGLVLDSVSFDTFLSENPVPARNYSSENSIFYKYEDWLMTN